MARESKGGSKKGQLVSKSQLAHLFGVSLPTVDGWLRNNCPVVERGGSGKPGSYNTADVADWLRARAKEEATGTATVDEAELKRRLQVAKTETAELELAKARGDVAPIDQMTKAWVQAFAEVRANMRNVASRAVTQLIGETDETRFKSVLLSEIDQALESCADVDLVTDEDLEIYDEGDE